MPVALLALSALAIGAPIMVLLTAKLPRKRTLILLMIIFITCCVRWPNSYNLLMLACVVTALCHSVFFGNRFGGRREPGGIGPADFSSGADVHRSDAG